MLTVNEAFDRIMASVAPFAISRVPLADAVGLNLAEDVHSTIDSPPFDKALMDGYAVRSADLSSGSAALQVIEIVTAGHIPTKTIGPGEAIQIMTGAPVPEGADAVVKVEDTARDNDRVEIKTKPVVDGMNLIRRGTSIRNGDCVLRVGQSLNGACIGALAELGVANVRVRRRPRVAILATGDELVPINETPGPGQIRNSNESMLAAQVTTAGGIAVRLGIARDNQDELRSKIQQGLQFDILVLSGGVSAGTLDLVPSVLTESGVREVFHKVEMKPGKPIWFGTAKTPGITLDTYIGSESWQLGLAQKAVDLSQKSHFERVLAAMTEEERMNPEGISFDRLRVIKQVSLTPPGTVETMLREFRQFVEQSNTIHKQFNLYGPGECYVFGLPGNPISSLVCFELFTRTAIRRLMGVVPATPQPVFAALEHDYSNRNDRPTYHPARLTQTKDGLAVTLVPWHGSSDLCGTVTANGMAFLPDETRQFKTGDRLETFHWSGAAG